VRGIEKVHIFFYLRQYHVLEAQYGIRLKWSRCPTKLTKGQIIHSTTGSDTRVKFGTDFESVGTFFDHALARNTGYIGRVGNGPTIATLRELSRTLERIGYNTSTTALGVLVDINAFIAMRFGGHAAYILASATMLGSGQSTQIRLAGRNRRLFTKRAGNR